MSGKKVNNKKGKTLERDRNPSIYKRVVSVYIKDNYDEYFKKAIAEKKFKNRSHAIREMIDTYIDNGNFGISKEKSSQFNIVQEISSSVETLTLSEIMSSYLSGRGINGFELPDNALVDDFIKIVQQRGAEPLVEIVSDAIRYACMGYFSYEIKHLYAFKLVQDLGRYQESSKPDLIKIANEFHDIEYDWLSDQIIYNELLRFSIIISCALRINISVEIPKILSVYSDDVAAMKVLYGERPDDQAGSNEG